MEQLRSHVGAGDVGGVWGAAWLLCLCGGWWEGWGAAMEEEGCAIIAKGEGRGGIYRAVRECVVTSAAGPRSSKAGKLRKKDEIVPICSAQFLCVTSA